MSLPPQCVMLKSPVMLNAGVAFAANKPHSSRVFKVSVTFCPIVYEAPVPLRVEIANAKSA